MINTTCFNNYELNRQQCVGPKSSPDNEIKICFLLGREVMTNLDSIKKQRHHFINKCPSS